MTDSAWCSSCLRWLPLEAFRPNADLPSGHHPTCRECVSAYGRAWRAANRETVDGYNRERREAYAEARGPLERVCANPDCGRTFTPSRIDARTCSDKCRDHLRYLRRKGRA